MSYVLPTWNITANIWRHTNPTTNPPDVVTVGNLSPGRIVSMNPLPGMTSIADAIGGMWLRVPARIDIRDVKWGSNGDIVEAPAGSGRFYYAGWVDDIAIGFGNEHRFAWLVWIGGPHNWPVPFPGGGTPPPPPLLAWTGTSGGTGGALTQTVGIPYTMPSSAGSVVLIAFWYNTGSPTVPSCPPLTILPGTQGVDGSYITAVAWCAIFEIPSLSGSGTFTLGFPTPADTAAWQWHLFLCNTPSVGGPDNTTVLSGTAGSPTLTLSPTATPSSFNGVAWGVSADNDPSGVGMDFGPSPLISTPQIIDNLGGSSIASQGWMWGPAPYQATYNLPALVTTAPGEWLLPGMIMQA